MKKIILIALMTTIGNVQAIVVTARPIMARPIYSPRATSIARSRPVSTSRTVTTPKYNPILPMFILMNLNHTVKAEEIKKTNNPINLSTYFTKNN
jgi:hypothetical protein